MASTLACGEPELVSRPCAQPGFDAIAHMAGTWTVRAEDRIDGRFEASHGESTIRRTADPCSFLEEYRGEREGRPFTMVSLLVAGPGGVQQARLDSGHGRVVVAEGGANADSVVLIASTDLGDRILRNRYVIDTGAGRIRRETHLSRALDAPWELVHRAEYARRD